MGRHKRYVDNFWVEDLTSTAGFDALSQRMREGRKLCKEIEEYLKQRSKIEAQYSRDLQKLNKQDHKEDLAGLQNAWRDLKIQTENIAQVHDIAARQFQKIATEIASFNTEQKKTTKDLEDKVAKLHSAARSTFNKVNNQQKVYISKFDESEIAESTVKYNEKHSGHVTPKDMEKARSKADKARDDLERADALYQSLVTQVRSEMTTWEKEMTNLCNTFQELDEKRIDYLRDYLWQCTNIDSQSNVDHDQGSNFSGRTNWFADNALSMEEACSIVHYMAIHIFLCCEHVRASLERCDIDKDSDNFIEKNYIGGIRPARVEYKGHSRDFRDSKKSDAVKDRGRLPSLPKKGGHVYDDVICKN